MLVKCFHYWSVLIVLLRHVQKPWLFYSENILDALCCSCVLLYCLFFREDELGKWIDEKEKITIY